jgi:kynureninase
MTPDLSSPDALLRFRPGFPILERTTYLISNSLGAMPRAAAAALVDYAETWATRGVGASADSRWDMSVSVGDVIASPPTSGEGGSRVLHS